jgi:flagellar hook protein FlgE
MSGISLSGMRDATARLAVAADNVANAATGDFKPASVVTAEFPGGGVQSTVVAGDVEGVDLATELVGMMVARAAFTANAKMLSTTSRVDRRALDLIA